MYNYQETSQSQDNWKVVSGEENPKPSKMAWENLITSHATQIMQALLYLTAFYTSISHCSHCHKLTGRAEVSTPTTQRTVIKGNRPWFCRANRADFWLCSWNVFWTMKKFMLPCIWLHDREDAVPQHSRMEQHCRSGPTSFATLVS